MRKIFLVAILILVLVVTNASAENKPPLIGITPSFSNNTIQINNEYADAVQRNGGFAVILVPTDDENAINAYVKMLDGAVLSGGPDIPPEFYGQEPHATTKVMENIRFEFERRFIKAFLDSGKPVLGTCLGMQFSNVCRGGTLIQDIPQLVGKKVIHRDGKMYTNFHPVAIAAGSLLEQILKTRSTRVISRHHQAIEKLGTGFVPVARSSDGIVEAIERTDGTFGLFVQWHPESMKDADPEHSNNLFGALVRAAREQKAPETEW
ncbi:MAG: gamma-glutamyl-gamma-aminobutyrate hydrolase family protein [Candidatus Riflebacteria bacterium]|nr:gamma-glutamyl-gamma-aminobutyrate hydrolase family protein [Candidatus Riflebacteria bacterium]